MNDKQDGIAQDGIAEALAEYYLKRVLFESALHEAVERWQRGDITIDEAATRTARAFAKIDAWEFGQPVPEGAGKLD